MAGFIFGAGTPYKSHADVMRQREIANALIQQSQQGASANSIPEGVANLGVGIMAALMGAKVKRDEVKGKASYNDSFKAVTRSLLGGQGPQASGPFKGTVVPTSAPPPGGKPSGNVSPDIVTGIQATAQSLGIDPVDLATAISYETAGTFDPAKKGPTTKWGTHRGLIQFGEPQAAQYGVDWNNPVGSQLGPEGAVAKYLKATGVKPGMGLLDIYSAINAGGVGLYNRSDAAAGGAPGTVADKVRDQMDGHRAKAVALLGGSGAPPMVQMASAAPSSGIGPMGFQAPQMPVQAAPVSQPQIMPASAAPPQMAPAALAMGNQPMTAYHRTFARSQEREGGNVGPIARGQMARVMGQDPVQAMAPPQGGQPMAGGRPAIGPEFVAAILPANATPDQAAEVNGVVSRLDAMSIEQLIELANSPYAEDWQKEMLQMYIKTLWEKMNAPPPDPLDQRKKELEIAKLEQGLQPPAPSPTDDMREYQYAITQGYKGTFADWQTQNRKAGATNINMGGGTDKQIYESTEKRADAARAARTGLFSLEEAQKALPGAITGAAADQRLALQKIGALFGVSDTQSIIDTETFRSAIAPQVAAMLKATVGSTQISNADREFAEKAAAGSISLDGQSIARLINIMQAANSEIIRSFNADLERVYPSEGGQFERERAIFNVPNVPKRYPSPIGPTMPDSAPQQSQPSQVQPDEFNLSIDQLPEGQTVQGEDGNFYMKRNGRLWQHKKGIGWEEVK